MGQQVVFAAVLAQATGVHHGDGVAGLRHHAEVVGDHDDRQATLVAQVQQQAQDLRLHGHIEGRGRLIGDQHLRVAAQGHGDHRALAHAAGKLMGIVVDPRLGIRDPHLAQHVDGLQARAFLRRTLMQANPLGDLLALFGSIVFSMSDAVLVLLNGAAVSYLGLGVQPPTAEWGTMVAEGQAFITTAWWLCTFPGLAIVTLAMGFSLLADGVAQVLGDRT